jgi:hydrophobic/amphiphilic exporter-1 (mainly G- bacteria), HAE1 family
VTANAALGYGQNDVQAALEKAAADLNLPSGYELRASGFTQEGSKTAQAFVIALLLSVVFMYLVLAAQFESWLHPITIMVASPLTIPFALMSILLFQGSLNVFTGLGLFVLFGIVKKNFILQVDHTNHLRAEGKPRSEAILQANRDRLRPILMTTIAFVEAHVLVRLRWTHSAMLDGRGQSFHATPQGRPGGYMGGSTASP